MFQNKALQLSDLKSGSATTKGRPLSSTGKRQQCTGPKKSAKKIGIFKKTVIYGKHWLKSIFGNKFLIASDRSKKCNNAIKHNGNKIKNCRFGAKQGQNFLILLQKQWGTILFGTEMNTDFNNLLHYVRQLN